MRVSCYSHGPGCQGPMSQDCKSQVPVPRVPLRMNTIRVFFSKIRALFSIFKKGLGRGLSPAPVIYRLKEKETLS